MDEAVQELEAKWKDIEAAPSPEEVRVVMLERQTGPLGITIVGPERNAITLHDIHGLCSPFDVAELILCVALIRLIMTIFAALLFPCLQFFSIFIACQGYSCLALQKALLLLLAMVFELAIAFFQ